MESNGLSLSVRVHGHDIKEFDHRNPQGQAERWVEGRRGIEFTLRVTNTLSSQVLAMVSVDGQSVMDGEPADFDRGGYVIEPFVHLDIPGWRLDNARVARFKFSDPKRSYSKKSGKGIANAGVIGVAAFHAKHAPPIFRVDHDLRPITVHHQYYGQLGPICWPMAPQDVVWTPRITWTSNNYTQGAQGAPADAINCSTSVEVPQDSGVVMDSCGLAMSSVREPPREKSVLRGRSQPSLGTEFGKAQEHRVETVVFDRQENPFAVLVLRYGDREELLERGVDMRRRPKVHSPQAFPGKGCKPPAGWRG